MTLIIDTASLIGGGILNYFGSRCWPVFLLVGILCMILSVRMQEILWSVSLGVLGVSCFWSIKELKEQEKRVAKGWFPKRKVDKH